MQYEARKIERKWLAEWKKKGTYRVETGGPKPKFYVLDMFPYPSGAGLHVGHPLGYIASDILSRYKRLRGFNVLHPMGFDSFGLPAEQYAIEHGIHPQTSTETNIERYIEQLENIGFSFDWSRKVSTHEPRFYKWTQWIFLQMFNAWYSLDADKALNISDLEAIFEKEGNTRVRAANNHEGIFSAADWASFSEKEKADALMNYRLMYRKTSYVNWCEALGTVLANDEITNGVSERGGHPVTQKGMMQWSMRTTAYAERLLLGLEKVDFPESLKAMQRAWVGRSEGAQLFFDIDGHDEKLEIFTTRADTIFGATFMVLAPEHDLVEKITTEKQRETVKKYLEWASSRSEIERMSDKSVSGAATGAFAVNPFSGQKIPIFIAEYVLKSYGTGAIMAVPADDERDQKFAEKFNLPIISIIDKSMHPGAGMEDKVGKMINSDFLNGLEVKAAIALILQKIEEKGIGKRRINYKLRDAGYARQRYWGEPMPINYDKNGVAHGLPEAELPLLLPPTNDFSSAGNGKGPLGKLKNWFEITPPGLPKGEEKWERETDTMPGFAGSSWYFLRYMDPSNEAEFASKTAIDYWQDVDFYIGGAEHAVGHLMYSRMWHKFLFDKNLVPTDEPYKKLVNQGMIQGIVVSIYFDKSSKRFISADCLDKADSEDLAEILVHADFVSDYGDVRNAYLSTDGIQKFKTWKPDFEKAIFVKKEGSEKFFVKSEVGKMSKSKYNVVNPDTIIEQYGTDCFRMYEMFLGPIEQGKPWDTKGITGVSSFLKRFWSLFFDEKTSQFHVSNNEPTGDEQKILHTAIKKVTEDIERFSMNTCVSNFMIAVNDLKKLNSNKKAILEPLTILLAPFAPHMAEEIWQLLGNSKTVCDAIWPVLNEDFLKSATINYPIQVNGKLRANLDFPAAATAAEIEPVVLSNETILRWMEGRPLKKFVFIAGRMVNIVA